MQAEREEGVKIDTTYIDSGADTAHDTVPLVQNDIESRSDGPLLVRKQDVEVLQWPQYFATFVVVLGAMTMGTSLGWTSPALVHLNHAIFPNETSEDFLITVNEASWIGSFLPIGALLGGISGGFFGKYGRKAVMYMAALLYFIGYLLMCTATNVWYLYFGRIFCGFACGLTTVSCPTYIAEIATPQVRGLLGSTFQVMITIGILYVNVLGTFFGWKTITGGCMAIDVLWVVLMLCIPETPHFLSSKQKYDAARSSLQFLRGNTYVDNELGEIEELVKYSIRTKTTLKDIGKLRNLKPLLISILIMFGQQFSGVNAIMFYGTTIFEAAHTNLNSFVECIILSGMQVTTTIISALIVDKCGRRFLLISSGGIMSLSISCLGAYFYILDKQGISAATNVSFLPLPSLCIYIIAFSIGFGGIPWLMMSESLPLEVKSLSSSIAATSYWAMVFVVATFYPPLAENIGIYNTFWGFAGLLLMSLVLIILFVPETKGKSLEEIQQLFRSNEEEHLITDEENPELSENHEEKYNKTSN